MRYNQNLFGNMGSLQGFMVFENISEDERQRAEEIMKEKYTGTRNAGKVGIINRKFDWIELGKAPKELEFLGSYEAMRDTVLAIQGVPKDMVVGGSTFENAKEAQRIFQMYTIRPLVEQIQNALNRQLMNKYSNQSLIVFDNPVEADKKIDTDIISKQYQAGIITLNEARQALGYSVLDYGDELINSNKKQKEVFEKIENIINEHEQEKKTKQVNEIREKIRTELNLKQLETENQILPEIQKAFENQKNRILKKIKNKKNITINFFNIDWTKEDVEFYNDFKAIVDYIIQVYEQQVSDFIGFKTKLEQEKIEQIKKEEQEIVKFINQTTRIELQKIVNDAILNNLTIDDLIEEIKKLYNQYSISRAETIARTETTRIKSFTQKNLYEASDAVEQLQWLSAKDKNTRLEHARADGQIINKGEKFYVGGEFLEYPGDRRGRPHNTINCRCDVIPLLKK
jgi:SPP1 gp7 family putative phage head morphogenesis protein